MRARLVVVYALVVALFLASGSLLSPAFAARPLHLAQEEEGDQGEEVEQRPAQPSSPAPSPSATEGEEETGPPWTYQMARISLLLLALLFLAMAAAYYRFVVKRQRGEV
ncbi:MAG TPA: hypothetical protein VIG64_11940 [Actinomycetota bacterium]